MRHRPIARFALAVAILCASPSWADDTTGKGHAESSGGYSTNPEMTAIFEADQSDRMNKPIDWATVGKRDDQRLKRTEELLDSGALESGEDFEHAAFVFQHGGKPEDYLKAHLLATIAVARGRTSAVWISAATLDRYLKNIGKPQVLGTQYFLTADGTVTQEPYDRTFASDSLREALHVRSLADQEKQRQDLEKTR